MFELHYAQLGELTKAYELYETDCIINSITSICFRYINILGCWNAWAYKIPAIYDSRLDFSKHDCDVSCPFVIGMEKVTLGWCINYNRHPFQRRSRSIMKRKSNPCMQS